MGFEQGFSSAERAAATVGQAAGTIARVAKQMQKAAAEGNIANLRKASERLDSALEVARQEIANSRTSWPFTAIEEEDYLKDGFEREVLDTARSDGLKISVQDERLIAFPSVVRILPNERAVRIDRTRVVAIRPTKLVALLKANQTKRPKFASDRFLETLYRAYRLTVGPDGDGKVVPLAKLYDALTMLPGSGLEYGKSDFGRDIFLLDRSGLTAVKSGRQFSLPASTATRDGSGVFSFVAEDGELVKFWGIRFSEGD